MLLVQGSARFPPTHLLATVGQLVKMSTETRTEHHERVVRTIEYNTGGSTSDALDGDHTRVHLCANGGYPIKAINDALEAGELREVKGGYAVADRAELYRDMLLNISYIVVSW